MCGDTFSYLILSSYYLLPREDAGEENASPTHGSVPQMIIQNAFLMQVAISWNGCYCFVYDAWYV